MLLPLLDDPFDDEDELAAADANDLDVTSANFFCDSSTFRFAWVSSSSSMRASSAFLRASSAFSSASWRASSAAIAFYD